MKVTIDTKEDSHEDIKKVLHILTNILQNKETTEPVADTTNMMSMFSSEKPEPQESAPDFTSFLNLANKEEKKEEEEAKVQFF